MTQYASLSPNEITAGRLTNNLFKITQLRMHYYRILACRTFEARKGLEPVPRDIARECLRFIENCYGNPAQLGFHFLAAYHYATWMAKLDKNLAIERRLNPSNDVYAPSTLSHIISQL